MVMEVNGNGESHSRTHATRVPEMMLPAT